MPRGRDRGTYPLEEVLGSVLLMPVLAGFRSYARCPCSSPREKLGPVPVTTGAAEGERGQSERGCKVQGCSLPRRGGESHRGTGQPQKEPRPLTGLVPNVAESVLILWVRSPKPAREAKLTL